ncbi:MAG: ThiF family adenylyltransferase [Christensenellaceae bacterium]
MKDIFEREELLIGADNQKRLSSKCVALFGLGGVGSYVAESLARAGIGKIIVVDDDIIQKSNINRQLFALHSTIGQKKTVACRERLIDINPDLTVVDHFLYFDETSVDKIDFWGVDYIVDAIDSRKSKVLLAKIAKQYNIPIISCLSTGNKLNNNEFIVTDIYNTEVCPLAKIMRSMLKKEGIESLKVVYSKEVPWVKVKDRVIPSISFVPSVAGLIITGEVIKDFLNEEN